MSLGLGYMGRADSHSLAKMHRYTWSPSGYNDRLGPGDLMTINVMGGFWRDVNVVPYVSCGSDVVS